MAKEHAYKSTSAMRTAQRISDAGVLRISSSDIFELTAREIEDVPQDSRALESDLVIIGLDFGTAFTKVAVSWMGDRGIVDWGKDNQGRLVFWVPSTFRRGPCGLQFGNQDGGGGADVNAIKMRLIASDLSRAEEERAVNDAVAYLGLVLRHAIGWTQVWVDRRGGMISKWSLNIGFPAKSLQDRLLSDRYLAVAVKAWKETVQRQNLPEAWSTPQIHVIPEFAAQLHGYLKDSHKARDSHLLIDVGAGTADFVAFIPHTENGRSVTPILSSSVRALGVHKLLAARVGSYGRGLVWLERDALLTHADLSIRCGQQEADIRNASVDFKDVFSMEISELISSAKMNNPFCRNLEADGSIPTFLCGGGGNADFFKNAVANSDYRIKIRSFPMPENLQWSGDRSAFHRVSVAYGLSFSYRNLGTIENTAELEPIEYRPRREIEDRDASR